MYATPVSRYKLLPAQHDFIHVDVPAVNLDVCCYQGGFGCLEGNSLIDLADGRSIPVKDFQGGYVVAWDGSQFIAAYATRPAVYDKKPLFEVVTESGQSITCTAEHRFLSLAGWVQMSHLAVGDALFLQPVSQRYIEGFSAQAYEPLSVGTHQASNLDTSRSALLSTEDNIKSIRYVKTDYYYDLHVPGFNNYCAQGFINHNSGKSFIGSFLGLELCRKYPGIRGLVGALTYPMVRDTTLESYFEHFDVLGFEDGVDYEWRDAKGIMSFPRWGDSKILFRHLEDSKKLKSLNLGFAHLEEMSELPESVFLMILSRIRQQGMPRKRVFGTTNPQASKGWIHKYFVETNKGPVVHEVNGQETVIHYRRVITSSNENIHLDAAYLLNMKNTFDPEYYRINVEGQDGDYRAGLVSASFSDLNIRDVPYNPEQEIFLSCDFNVDPMMWVAAHRNEASHEYFFFKDGEIVIENTIIDQCVDEFCRRFPNHPGGIRITGDASGNSRNVQAGTVGGTSYTQMMNRFAYNGYNGAGLPRPRVDVREANPRIADRVAAWNARVCNLQGVRSVFMDPSCKWLIYNCENLKYKVGTGELDEPTINKMKQDPNLKFLVHIFDAASYLIEKYDPIVLKPVKKKSEVIVPKALRFYG